MTKKTKENYLDFVPRPNRLFETSVNEAGHVEILTEHRGFYNKIAQKVFKKPRFSHIELDEFGTFIWNQMDGKKSIYEIGAEVKNQFGKKAEPLYERLSKFMKVLHDQHYIVYENKLTGGNKEA